VHAEPVRATDELTWSNKKEGRWTGEQFSMGNKFIHLLRRNEDTFGNTLRIPDDSEISESETPEKIYGENKCKVSIPSYLTGYSPREAATTTTCG
jgi:hypothetical protein